MKETRTVRRRQFLKAGATAGAGAMFLPGLKLFGKDAPSNKLNIALIGADGRARAHFGVARKENVVAICDVDSKRMARGAKEFPNAKQYADWRKLFDQEKGLDAIICATTDHTHAHVSNWALNRGLHVYCEKPLGNCVNEARVVRANYLKQKDKVATQIGTQRHEFENFSRVRELVLDGAIGKLSTAWAWGDRQIRRPGYLPAAGDPPETLCYDLWIGPSPYHPYNPGYIGGCLKWNMYWDFGSGQIGDMGSHTMDLAWNALDAELPTTAQGEGEEFNPDVTPVELHTQFDFPANDWRDAIKLHWYQGGMMPNSPAPFIDLKKIGHGAMFKGDKGFVVADFGKRILIPFGDKSDLTYFKRRTPETVIPPLGNFQQQWIDACKGDLKTSCNFEYAGNVIETMLLGHVAYRVGKKLKYDGATGQTNDAEANALLTRQYREGWPLDG